MLQNRKVSFRVILNAKLECLRGPITCQYLENLSDTASFHGVLSQVPFHNEFLRVVVTRYVLALISGA